MSAPAQSGLYIVATPIGNLGDLSRRAEETLAAADIILVEDTRVTGKLLNHIGKKSKMMVYNDHKSAADRASILDAIRCKIVALVSDAGTPLISDPGYKLVRDAQEADLYVTTIPGPSAAIAALTLSGLPSDRFLFAGFIPPSRNGAHKAFSEFADIQVTSIWFESPRRLAASLSLMAEIFGPRLAVVARELTKLHEDLQRAPLDELASLYARQDPPRGEVVILVGGASQTMAMFDDAMLKNMLTEEMQNSSLRDAVKTVTEMSGQPRRKIYQLAIELDM